MPQSSALSALAVMEGVGRGVPGEECVWEKEEGSWRLSGLNAGGSLTYINRGLYNYQPLYMTPTTSLGNLIQGNLIQSYGLSHTDLGATYTLSKSPSTMLTENYALNSNWYGMYTDEGSNSYIITQNDYLSNGNWYAPNQGCTTCGVHNGNNTLIDNFGHTGPDQANAPNGTGNFNDSFIRNYEVSDLGHTNEHGHRVAYRAGILPGRRGNRPVSNPDTQDSYLSLVFPTSLKGQIVATASNFDDVDFTRVDCSTSASYGSHLLGERTPHSIPANSIAVASWSLSTPNCVAPFVSVDVTYTNPRTKAVRTISTNGTFPGVLPLQTKLQPSSTWPAAFGQVCDAVGIRTSDRDVSSPYDDWASLYKAAVVGANGSVTAKVLSMDPVDPWSKAGVVARNSLAANGQADGNRALGYATVAVTPGNGVTFQWDSSGDGIIDNFVAVAGVTAPVSVRLTVSGPSYSGFYYVDDGTSWTQIGLPVTIGNRNGTLDAGVLLSSHAGFTNATALFDSISFQ